MIAVVATGSRPEERQAVMERIEMIQPLLDLVAASLHHARQTRELENANRQLHNLHEIGRLTASSLDRDQIIDILARQVVDAGVLRSLTVALVDQEKKCATVMRSLTQTSKGLVSSGIGGSYDLDAPNMLSETIRQGETQIIVGCDPRIDAAPEHRRGQVAYFVPLKVSNQVIAVIATGSREEDQAQTTQLLTGLQPLWDQVAVSLSNASLYESAQREIAERKRLEAQLIHLERQSAASELAAGISHNLNNVLTSVLLPAEFLVRKSDEPETVRRVAENIRIAGERARDLVQRLSDAVRPGRGVRGQAVDLNSQALETVELARPRWKTRRRRGEPPSK